MTGHKNGKYLEFTLDNGKVVKYDLSTGESIGVKGKPVKTVSHYMQGYSINVILDSIDDENYRNFLQFVIYNTRNRCAITNFGTILVRAKAFKDYEQYFSSGLKILMWSVPKFKDCPPKLISLARKYDICLDESIVLNYKEAPDIFHVAFSLDYISLPYTELIRLLGYRVGGFHPYFWISKFCDKYSYNAKSLLLYIDRIYSLEAVRMFEVTRNLEDYASMMSKISTKFDKYPRNLLTTHNIAVRNYNRLKEQFDDLKFKKRLRPELRFEYRNYTVVVPQCSQDIKDEAVQQNNCVASYIGRVIAGECDIVFLRRKDMPEKSLVTVEIRDNQIVQAKAAYNNDPFPSEQEVLKKYQTYLDSLKERIEYAS